MFVVKVTYDASNQQFRLVDPKVAQLLQDGELYLLVADFFPEDQEIEAGYIDFRNAEVGHA